jgi:hypothetical protein
MLNTFHLSSFIIKWARPWVQSPAPETNKQKEVFITILEVAQNGRYN